MGTPLRQRSVLGIVVVLVASLLAGVGAASRVAAASSELNGLKATGTLTADPYSTWYSQVSRAGVCRLLPGCVSSSGSASRWSLTMQVDVPGVGLQSMDVSARVTRQVPFRLMRLSLAGDSAAGTFRGDVTLALAASGSGTKVTLTIVSAKATGALVAAIPLLRDNLQDNLRYQLALMDAQRAAAGATVTLALAKRKKTTASIRVVAPGLTSTPPTARGTARVLVGSTVVCQARVKASAARCSFRPPKRRALVRAVVVGSLSDGGSVWTSGTRRAR